MGQPRPRGRRCGIKSWGGKLLLSSSSLLLLLLSLMRAPQEAEGSDRRMMDPFCKHFSCLYISNMKHFFIFFLLSLYGALTSSLFPLLLLSLLRSHSPLQSRPPPSNVPVHQKRNTTVQRDFNTRMDRQLLRSIFSLFSPATMIIILTMDSRIEPLLSLFCCTHGIISGSVSTLLIVCGNF